MTLSVKEWLKHNPPTELYFGTSYLRYDKFIRGKGIGYHYKYVFSDTIEASIHWAERMRDNDKLVQPELLKLSHKFPQAFKTTCLGLVLVIKVNDPEAFELKADYGRNRNFQLKPGSRIEFKDILILKELPLV